MDRSSAAPQHKALYTYACHEDEAELCRLELETLFGQAGANGALLADAAASAVSVHRSPFVKRRMEAACEAAELTELADLIRAGTELEGDTFKVQYVAGDEKHSYEERRELERIVGAAVRGKADMRRPARVFGLARIGGRWLFGPSEDNTALWLKHQQRPQNYSTALPTRAARAIVNIAAGPEIGGKRLVDPCCGMGTVLLEALSMGADIDGMDINPLAARGARTNLRYFGYSDDVRLGDMNELDDEYDAAIVDMPYNLCSVLPAEEQLAMLRSIRRLAARAVIVTTENIAAGLEAAGLRLTNRALLSKGTFTRYVSVVE